MGPSQSRRADVRIRGGLLATLYIAGLALGCVTSTQRIQVTCVPERVEIYVDGRLLEAGDLELELSTKDPHKVFVKAPGYEPTLVVLEPAFDAEGRPSLGPDRLCIQPVPVGLRRQLELEVEEP